MSVNSSPDVSPPHSHRKRPHQKLVDKFGVSWDKNQLPKFEYDEEQREWIPALVSQKGASSKAASPERSMERVDEEKPYEEARPDTPPQDSKYTTVNQLEETTMNQSLETA